MSVDALRSVEGVCDVEVVAGGPSGPFDLLLELPHGATTAEDFAALTRRYGVEIIAEKVEAERQIVDILELNVAFGQGNLFQEPRPIRDAVLAEADPPAPVRSTNAARRAMGGADWRRL